MEPFECESITLVAEDIMTRGVITIGPNTTLFDVITLMHDKRISSIIILDDDKKFYTISHSDIINFIFHNPIHQPFSEVSVKAVMKGPVEPIGPQTSIDEVVFQMQNQGLKRVLIAEKKTGELLGIVTTHDLMIWNSNILKRAIPIVLLVIENNTSILLAKHVFNDMIDISLLDLFSGSLSAVDSILEEVMKKSGRIKTIQKELFTILLENTELITSVLIVDHSSIDIRRRLQDFTNDFASTYSKQLDKRKDFPGPIDQFNITKLIDKFKYLNKF